MDRKKQIAFVEGAEERFRANVEQWRQNDAYRAALSKYDHLVQKKPLVARA